MALRRLLCCLGACLGLGAAAVSTAAAQANGVLGIFFDDRASKCADTFAVGTSRTLYVVLLPEGDTLGGITGTEFRIDASAANGYRFSGETVVMPEATIFLGSAVGAGVNIAASECQSRAPLAILRVQVTNVSGGKDGVVQIAAKSPPSNRSFPCPLVTLCDYPAMTAICIAPERAVFNPSGSLRCGSNSEQSDWGRVKELYR